MTLTMTKSQRGGRLGLADLRATGILPRETDLRSTGLSGEKSHTQRELPCRVLSESEHQNTAAGTMLVLISPRRFCLSFFSKHLKMFPSQGGSPERKRSFGYGPNQRGEATNAVPPLAVISNTAGLFLGTPALASRHLGPRAEIPTMKGGLMGQMPLPPQVGEPLGRRLLSR